MKNNAVKVGIGLITFCVLAIGLTGTWASRPTPVFASNPSIRSLSALEVPKVPACDSNWTVVTSPNVETASNYLNAVGAVSSNDVWAVGY